MNKPIRLMIPLLIALAACAPAGPGEQFRTGAEIITYTFSEPNTFEEGTYTGSDATLRIIDDVYRISLGRGDNELWWGQWGDTLSDVVIDVDVEQTTERQETAYGIGCRMSGTVGQPIELDSTMLTLAAETTPEATDEAATAIAQLASTEEATSEATDEAATPEAEATEVPEETAEEATEAATEERTTEEAAQEATEEFEEGAASEVRLTEDQIADGDGYLFLIQGTGSFAIMRSQDRALTPLVNWRQSGEINQGAARNQLRAVCVGDYLAFYANGKFLADARDSTYSSGQVALLASAANRLGVRVEFDNLKISEAEPGSSSS